jgi:predicted DNA-binding protein YlxM (UPF0122 family)
MDELLEQSLLYDFYGELLTEHQRKAYEAYLFEDLSLAEIAEEQGISRQGVHDMVKRSRKTLQDYEDKLGLVKRFADAKEQIGQIRKLTDTSEGLSEEEVRQRFAQISKLASGLLEEF